MVTLKSFTDDTAQVEHLIKWWISRSTLRYHRVRKHGTTMDFINDVWCRLLRDFRDDKEVDCSLSTAVVHSCEWEIVAWRRLREKKTWEARDRMRRAEKVKDHHRIENERNTQQIDVVNGRELDDAIAGCLRSLTWREAVIVRAQFGLLGDSEMTLEQIGRLLKITRERVRQIGMKGLKKLQHHTRAVKLLPFAPDYVECSTKLSAPLPEKEVQRLSKTECGRILLDELTTLGLA